MRLVAKPSFFHMYIGPSLFSRQCVTVWLAGHGSVKPENLKEKDQFHDCPVQASLILEVHPGQASLTPSQDFRKRAQM